ncbi:hypothetical protein D3C85_989530 [compost metagenome]
MLNLNLNLFKPKAPRAQAERLFPKELMTPERDWSLFDKPSWQRVGVSNEIIDVLISQSPSTDALSESFEQRKQRLLNQGETLRSFAVASVAVVPEQLPVLPAIEQMQQVHSGEFIEREQAENDDLGSIAGWITGTVQYMGYHPYKFRKNQNTCYVVRLDGRDVWGVELASALKDAGVNTGDKIAIKKIDKSDVVVQQRLIDSTGNIIGSKEVHAKKNHWIVRVVEIRENDDESHD